MTVGVLPNVNPVSQNRDVNSAQSARFRTGRLKNKKQKAEEGWRQKCSSYCEKCATVELCTTGR